MWDSMECETEDTNALAVGLDADGGIDATASKSIMHLELFTPGIIFSPV